MLLMIMITIFMNKSNPIYQKKYNNMINNLPLHKLECTCRQKGNLIKHGYYERSIIFNSQLTSLKILRVKCKSCGKTHAILPECIVPYSRILLNDHLEIIKTYRDNKPFNIIMNRNFLIDEGHIRYIIRNFNNHWKERLNTFNISFDNNIIKLCFKHFKRQFMQIKQTPNILFS